MAPRKQSKISSAPQKPAPSEDKPSGLESKGITWQARTLPSLGTFAFTTQLEPPSDSEAKLEVGSEASDTSMDPVQFFCDSHFKPSTSSLRNSPRPPATTTAKIGPRHQTKPTPSPKQSGGAGNLLRAKVLEENEYFVQGAGGQFEGEIEALEKAEAERELNGSSNGEEEDGEIKLESFETRLRKALEVEKRKKAGR